MNEQLTAREQEILDSIRDDIHTMLDPNNGQSPIRWILKSIAEKKSKKIFIHHVFSELKDGTSKLFSDIVVDEHKKYQYKISRYLFDGSQSLPQEEAV